MIEISFVNLEIEDEGWSKVLRNTNFNPNKISTKNFHLTNIID
jgi:hypothetical protein